MRLPGGGVSAVKPSRPPPQGSHDQEVVAYYEETYLDYRLLWMSPRTLAMHFGFWDQRTRSHDEALLNMNRVLAARAEVRPGDRVLDAGCGVGGSAIWLARQFDVQVVGISLVPSQVERARGFADRWGVSSRVSFELRDFARTELPNSSFDVVWVIESVCHATHKGAFLAEAGRLLKPGGRLVLADWFRRRRPFEADDERLLGSWLSGWAVPDLATGEELLEGCRKAGLLNCRIDDVTENVRPSLRRLYRLALVGYPCALLLRALRLRSARYQRSNPRSALLQYRALRRGLWFYGIASATADEGK